MGMGKAVANITNDASCLTRINPFATGRVIERFAAHHLHNDVRLVLKLTKIMHTDNIRVIEFSHVFGLRLKLASQVRIVAEVTREYFDGHLTIKRFLSRHIHRPHTPLSDKCLHLISRQELRNFLWLWCYKIMWSRGFSHRAKCVKKW